MHCPFCAANETKVIDSRLVAEGEQVRRRRECLSCGERFTTFETAELVMPRLIKQDGSRQPFDEDKLRAGMQRALEKRPVSLERLEAAIAHIKHKLRATGEREIKSLVLGELVMVELHNLDEVAYIRFASVYRRFQDLNEFREEIDRLSRGPMKEPGNEAMQERQKESPSDPKKEAQKEAQKESAKEPTKTPEQTQ